MPRGMKVSGTKGPSPWDPVGPFLNQEPWETSAASWASLSLFRGFFLSGHFLFFGRASWSHNWAGVSVLNGLPPSHYPICQEIGASQAKMASGSKVGGGEMVSPRASLNC